MTTESIKQLLALAAKATRGPWKTEEQGGLAHLLSKTSNECRHDTGQEWDRLTEYRLGGALALCDARYLAACSPDVIAELVNELLAAREIQERQSGDEYRLRFLLDQLAARDAEIKRLKACMS